MDLPVSFAQFFVNKQNIRSASNILKQEILKSNNETKFLMHMLQDQLLVSALSCDLRSILIQLRDNVKTPYKEDFNSYITNFKNMNHVLTSLNKNYVFVSCSIALRKIIPHSFFGCNRNYKIFNNITKIIINSMKHQYLNFSLLLSKWDLSTDPWKTLPQSLSFRILYCILFWLYRYLLSAMISLKFYVTTCKIDHNENKLHFFWKPAWQSFYDKTVSSMALAKTIEKIGKYNIQNNSLRNQKSAKVLKLNLLKREIPKLQLVLKTKNNDYRPIVNYKKDLLKPAEKYRIKEKLNFLKVLSGPPHTRIETQFSQLHANWLCHNRPKLYFIKTDLSNAFGSINRLKLLKILCEKHHMFQQKEKLACLRKRFALLYREFVIELKKPLVIRTGSTIYEWKEGLVQGYKYSPALSELYYSYLDQLYFSDHLKNENKLKLFIRVVDDYLYVTSSLEDAHAFLRALTNYRNINYSKTVVNFSYPNIKQSSQITFLGYTYDTENLNVSRARNVFIGQMCYKIAFNGAISNISKFIENRIGQSSVFISSLIFNFNYNNEALIWQHLFISLCLSANKFCSILAILCDEKDMPKYLPIYKKKVTIHMCNSVIETLMMNIPKGFEFVYCINHFRYLSYKALLLCSHQSSKCNGLVPHVNTYLLKTNCMFGKWRNHSGRINTNGSGQSKADRAICKRHDLKIIMKGFDMLPEGVECYKKDHDTLK